MEQRIRSAAIIVNDEQRILLIKHVHPETGYEWWVPPGGGIEEFDNSVFDCARREVFEEANLKVDINRIAYIREFFIKKDKKLNIEIFTLADNYEGELSLKNIAGKGSDEQFVKDVRWFSREELQDIVVFPEILKDYFWSDYAENFPTVKYLGRQVQD